MKNDPCYLSKEASLETYESFCAKIKEIEYEIMPKAILGEII